MLYLRPKIGIFPYAASYPLFPMNSLTESPQVRATLSQLHTAARADMPNILKGLSKGVFRKLQPEDMAQAYIAISAEQGQLLYALARGRRATHIVEFGTSFGISTLYLAAAARDNGGKVITTELLPEKCAVARQHFAQAGLDAVIDLREGDALLTLRDVPDGIDFLLLDGWNDLYLPLLKLLEPKFAPGAMILTDNSDFPSAKPFLHYVRNSPRKYTSQRLRTDKGGTEMSIWLGADIV